MLIKCQCLVDKDAEMMKMMKVCSTDPSIPNIGLRKYNKGPRIECLPNRLRDLSLNSQMLCCNPSTFVTQ